jgi:hypothetical protein
VNGLQPSGCGRVQTGGIRKAAVLTLSTRTCRLPVSPSVPLDILN